jgi:predicted aspartyl protease
MNGFVNANLEAVVPLDVFDVRGQVQNIHGIIDTGFDGELTLPPALVAVYGLVSCGRLRTLLGDGSIQFVDEYDVTVTWEGQPRLLRTQAIGLEPLIGMELLRNHDVKIEVVDGGSVTITPRPTP